MILSVPYERQHVMIPVNISCVCKHDYVHMLSYKALHDAFRKCSKRVSCIFIQFENRLVIQTAATTSAVEVAAVLHYSPPGREFFGMVIWAEHTCKT